MRMANCIVMYGSGNWGRVRCGYFTNSRLLKCEMAQSRWGTRCAVPRFSLIWQSPSPCKVRLIMALVTNTSRNKELTVCRAESQHPPLTLTSWK